MAPRRDHFQFRRQAGEGQLEAHLVVALAGGAVADRVGAFGARDLDLLLRDHRARDRSAEQVVALIDCVGAQHREDEVARELLAQIFDVELARAGLQRLLLQPVGLFGLADIGAERDHLAVIVVAEPAQDDGSVESAGVRQHDFFDFRRRHASS